MPGKDPASTKGLIVMNEIIALFLPVVLEQGFRAGIPVHPVKEVLNDHPEYRRGPEDKKYFQE